MTPLHQIYAAKVELEEEMESRAAKRCVRAYIVRVMKEAAVLTVAVALWVHRAKQ